MALTPSDASAQTQNCGCDIQITQAPSSGEVGEAVGPFRVQVECYQTQWITYSLENWTNGEYIMGPTTYNDEGRYTFTANNHAFSSAGNKQLRAQVNALGSGSCDFYDTDTDSISISGGGSASMDVSISGPSSVTLPSGDSSVATRYDADFDWSGDEASYRFFLGDNSYSSGWKNLSGSSASDYVSFSNTGTYEVCAQGTVMGGGVIDADTNCMLVTVEKPEDPVIDCMDEDANNYNPNADIHDPDLCEYDTTPPPTEDEDATLRVRSQNPSSGARVTNTSGNLKTFNTPDEHTRSYDLSGTLWADEEASDGSNFSRWEGCDSDSGRRCDVSVNTGSSQTITAVYDGSGGDDDDDDDSDPDPDPSEATLSVNSSNPSSGASLTVTSGNLPSNIFTPDTFTNSNTITARIWARATHDGSSSGNPFSHWQGCDDSSSRRCDVNVGVGSSQSITAHYDDGGSPPPPPGQATLNVSAENPSNVSISVLNSDDISDFSTPETFTQGDRITATLWAPATASNGNTFDDWDGCPDVGTNNRRCDVDVSVDSTMTITAEYNDASVSGTRLRVRSDNPNSGVDITRVSGNVQSGTTASDSYDINISSGNITGTLEAEANAGGNSFSHWDGNCEPSSSGRQCDVNIADGTSRTVIAVYDEVSGPLPAIDNFRVANSPSVDFTIDPPQVFVGETYELIWSTTDADTVTASGDWSGNKSAAGSEYENQSSISGSEETFSYTLTAENSAGTAEETVEITVIDPPRFDLDSDAEADIQGAPGSSANVGVSVTSENYSGTVELEVAEEDIPESLKDSEGNSKISFSFADEQIDTAGNTSLFIEV